MLVPQDVGDGGVLGCSSWRGRGARGQPREGMVQTKSGDFMRGWTERLPGGLQLSRLGFRALGPSVTTLNKMLWPSQVVQS